MSAAAGSTGGFVCQIAKRVLGIEKVIGIVGSDEKCEFSSSILGKEMLILYRQVLCRDVRCRYCA